MLILGLFILLSDILDSGEPAADLFLVISSKNFAIEDILKTVDGIEEGLIPKKNKKEETPTYKHSRYKHAYWYSYRGSDTYGIALIEWDDSSWDHDDFEMGGKYFIDVYSDTKECKLCKAIKVALQQNKFEFSSPCEKGDNLTKYEKIRCKIK